MGRARSQGLYPGDEWFLFRVGEAKIRLCRQKVHSRLQTCVCVHGVTTMREQWTGHLGPSTLPPCWEETAVSEGAGSPRTHAYRLLCFLCLCGLAQFLRTNNRNHPIIFSSRFWNAGLLFWNPVPTSSTRLRVRLSWQCSIALRSGDSGLWSLAGVQVLPLPLDARVSVASQLVSVSTFIRPGDENAMAVPPGWVGIKWLSVWRAWCSA